MAHLVLFDGECALCHRSVRFILQRDRAEIFLFAPLQGSTARSLMGESLPTDTLVLLEQWRQPKMRQLRYGKAAFRILWLLGGWYRLPGLLSFLPCWIVDPCYRLVARNRHLFAVGRGDRPLEELAQGRLLP